MHAYIGMVLDVPRTVRVDDYVPTNGYNYKTLIACDMTHRASVSSTAAAIRSSLARSATDVSAWWGTYVQLHVAKRQVTPLHHDSDQQCV